ncbi:hypothetical protein PRZ48_010206 [Zasmidium cellare]|uniref:Ecp2 effector protein-like domain-containing protein n=1 Tax=Zasmidium cellare TaxID=395010 RepID=A0ABR0EF42_ZASCE|nr:hypothetical protein PRZ48_010206 [Zasmidium cellare]
MYFTAAAIVALLPALGSATCYICGGASQSPLGASLAQDDGNPNAGNAPGDNACGLSTFTELTQNQQQPSVDDCNQMIANIQGDYSWPVDQQGETLASFRTCCFNARTQGGTGYVGNADIIDLTSDSIKQYGDNGYIDCQGNYHMFVSSAGGMRCDKDDWYTGKQVQVDWTLTLC